MPIAAGELHELTYHKLAKAMESDLLGPKPIWQPLTAGIYSCTHVITKNHELEAICFKPAKY
jgi:hypothetical protein